MSPTKDVCELPEELVQSSLCTSFPYRSRETASLA